ncbi:MAG: FAD/NAD(P)-binding protein [Ignavibacteria bacterium]|nr:FAD/NAD(P)-binding protein [Ignavibacteria bacterium]
MKNIPSIAIIGGGFCGAATFIQLVRQSEFPLNIVLINKENQIPKGLAYSSFNERHVLNVPAGKMSIFPEEPDHFINWIRSKKEYHIFADDELPDTFIPRVIYGKYLEEIFNDTISNLPDHISVNIINDEAVDIDLSDSGNSVKLKSGSEIFADKIVLAIGNFLPDNPKIRDNSFYNSEKYFQNPWNRKAVEGLKDNDNVLIIGTGLTMVDNVISLTDIGFKGKIYSVSTNGYFPLSHKKRKPYTDILEELHPPYEISKLYSLFRKHIKIVLSKGISGEAVVDAVRPKTQEIWLSLSMEDKIRFMAHIRHLWGVARHRLPKNIFLQMQDLISKGRLEIIGGRLQEIKEISDHVLVTIKEKKSQNIKELIVSRVINCTGPKTDISKIDQPLISNLYKKGLIVPDEMRLGINALPDGTIIHSDNTLSSKLFTTGSLLKGILWESTAVPELRIQAKSLAGELISRLYSNKNANA